MLAPVTGITTPGRVRAAILVATLAAACLLCATSARAQSTATPASSQPTASKPKPVKPAAPKPAAPKPAPVEKPPAKLKIPYPEWLFPIDPESLKPPKEPPKPPKPVPPPKKSTKAPGKEPLKPAAPEPPIPEEELLGIPESDQKYPLSRINDQFNAPDWHPNDHIPMPEIVATGRKPNVIACAYCHTPTGQGRPENSALAGLPEAYIKEQLEAFRSGKRAPVGPEAYKPSRGMHAVAKELTDEEIDASAKYFAQQKLARRHYVVEGINIPRAEPSDWVYKEVDGSEDLGERLLEVAPDITRHQRRDDRMQYTVYVPPGALASGKLLATKGDNGKTQACATCHLANLKGTDKIPPIAGRSPTYLLRQLIAFKNGTREGENAAQMTPVVEKLELADMVALAAYVGSLYP
jgi:cytochrome c553